MSLRNKYVFLTVVLALFISLGTAADLNCGSPNAIDSNLCDQCNPNFYKHDPAGGSSYSVCIGVNDLDTIRANGKGVYGDGTIGGTGIARSCNAPCVTCVDSTICRSCATNFYRYDPLGGTAYTECVATNDLDTLRNGRGLYVAANTVTTGTGIARGCGTRCVTCQDTAQKCTSCANKRPVFPIPN